MNFVRAFWAFITSRRKLWMIPILLILVVLGALLILAQSSAIAPFIYTLF